MKIVLFILVVVLGFAYLREKYGFDFLQQFRTGSSDAPITFEPRVDGRSSPRPTSSARNRSLRLLDNPDEMTAEELRLADSWANGDKERVFQELDKMRTVLESKTVSPYGFNSERAQAAKRAVVLLDEAAVDDDFLEVPNLFGAARDAIRAFESSVRWRAHISRGSGTHIHSGLREGTWEADPGYVLFREGSELVAKRELRCRDCQGKGSFRVQEYCSGCNGTGSVDNPAYQVGSAVSTGIDILNAFGGKRGRQMPQIRNNQPRTIRCNACNGSGRQQRTSTCSGCNGRGRVYE